MVPLYQSVLSGLLIGLKGEITGSAGVYSCRTACNNSNLDFDNENMWKGIEVDIDDDYHSRYKYISDKLCIRNERSSKEEVINKIYGQLKDIKTEELINNFI